MNESDAFRFSEQQEFSIEDLVSLYRAVGWSSADKPEQLKAALANSHSVISAWVGNELVGLGNSLSDGQLVVYYPHLLVRPLFQGKGIGKEIVERLKTKYHGIHQHILVAVNEAVDFYERCGFQRAGQTVSMWIYDGGDHDDKAAAGR